MNAGSGVRPAIAAAEAGSQAWRAVVHAQLAETLDHTDFYGLACEVVDALRSLDALAGVLGRQVAGYGHGRRLRDDDGAAPAERLLVAVARLAEMEQLLAQAERAANQFWSEIGHIAVEEH